MKMGTLSTIGYYKPANLIHICFDNNEYESTGGQKTTSTNVEFTKVAQACGYKSNFKINTIKNFEKIISNIEKSPKPMLLHIKIKSGSIEDLKRPSKSPQEMKKVFMEYLCK